MLYRREAAFLRDHAGDYVLDLIKKHRAFIAGGAITSAFSSARINDFDIFFRTVTDLNAAIAEVPEESKKGCIESECALSFRAGNHRIQLIKVLTGSPEDVIDQFDFTVCQAAFDGNEFLLGQGFMQHLAQRRLVYNTKNQFPICTLFRVRKFIQRGYRFSGVDAIKLGLRIHALEIKNYAALRKQLMGIDTLFLQGLTDSLKGIEEKEYDWNAFLSTLDEWIDKQFDALTSSGDGETDDDA